MIFARYYIGKSSLIHQESISSQFSTIILPDSLVGNCNKTLLSHVSSFSYWNNQQKYIEIKLIFFFRF